MQRKNIVPGSVFLWAQRHLHHLAIGNTRGGIKKGVLLGFWYGNKLNDADNYLTHGTNKQIFYKIYNNVEEINVNAVVKLLKEAVKLDKSWAKSN